MISVVVSLGAAYLGRRWWLHQPALATPPVSATSEPTTPDAEEPEAKE